MSAYIDVTISCKVWDAQALWEKACAYLKGENLEPDTIGTRDNPDVGACLIMLLDRSEHLDGADIEESSTEARDEIERLRAEARDARAALAAICP